MTRVRAVAGSVTAEGTSTAAGSASDAAGNGPAAGTGGVVRVAGATVAGGAMRDLGGWATDCSESSATPTCRRRMRKSLRGPWHPL